MFRRVTVALDALPVIVAGVLVGGVVVTFFSLFFVGHPDIGWSDHVMADAKAVATGHFPYGDPAHRYVGMLYTPLFTGVVALLVRVKWWEGWGPLVSMASVGATLFALARVVWRRVGPRRVVIVSASAVVALPLFAFTIFSTNGVFEGRTDQLAWCLFVFAACRVLEDLVNTKARSPRGRVLTGALLALSALAKQTTLSAGAVAVVVAALVAWRITEADAPVDVLAWRRWVPIEALTLVGVFGAALLVLQVASDGFAFDLLFQLPQRQARVVSVRDTVKADLKLLAVPIAALLSAVAIAIVGERRGRTQPATNKVSPLLAIGAALVLAAATVPGAVLAQSKQGGDTNNLAGPVWGLALVLATALVVSEPAWRATAVRTLGALLVLTGVIGSFSTALDESAFGSPSFDLTRGWHEVPKDLVVADEHGRTVFDWKYPSRSITPTQSDYPAGGGPPDLAAAGYTPRWLIRNLLDGRYDRVRLYPAFLNIYMSGYGRRDTALAWKIDQIMERGYRKLPSVRDGEPFYEPGPRLRDVQWLYSCFGPYEAGDVRIAVKEEGGLWCARHGGLALVDGPSPTSELVITASGPASFDIAGAYQLRGSGSVREQVNANGTHTVRLDTASASIVVDVRRHTQLAHFRSRGKDVAVRLHDPTPGELNAE